MPKKRFLLLMMNKIQELVGVYLTMTINIYKSTVRLM
ncbi:hypothetical protein GMA19_04186 [Paenibacillus polymyxa E681]|nr:hypothetical protein PPE_06365 [Paenibacillus polymyxa E681]QNV58981.1 hypothetical protein GE561_04188 [Paenibacillus polymyxa E681]QNV63816.1 hypothetical protein GMA19_04186 [Paenibacillus polymyxa E681]